jgi:glyceraldehyde 3-phosphate dehydrogenase
MKSIKVAINGFGRIGRLILRLAAKVENIEIVAVNDLADLKTLHHLLKYDSVHRSPDLDISYSESSLIINKNKISVFSKRDPKDLPWKSLNVDIVIESSGAFRKYDLLNGHIQAGAKRVLLTVPPKDNDIKMFVCGVNDHLLSKSDIIISNASCTTNCLAPLAKLLHEAYGIKSGLMTTIHSATNDQRVVDAAHSDLRRARSVLNNIIPTSTGAAKAVGKVIPELDSKLNGMAVRVPTQNGSLIDFTVNLNRSVDIKEINKMIKQASETTMKGIIEYSEDPIVSLDIIGNTHSCIYDSLSTMKTSDDLYKFLAWYDNEWGYASRLIDLLQKMI